MILLPAAVLGLIKQKIDTQLRLLTVRVRQNDIFIATYPRSGTTYLQMILYQLTTDGNMDFDHISQKSPWLERMLMRRRNPMNSMSSPRLIKTHLRYEAAPKGPSRYIYVVRDGRDVAASMHHFRKTGKAFDYSYKVFMAGKLPNGSWFEHVKGWWENKDGLNLLFLTYSQMEADPEGTIRRIAEFIDVPLDEERLARTMERSSLAYMREREHQFDYLHMPAYEKGLSGGRLIRRGNAGGRREGFARKMDTREMDMIYISTFNDHFGNEDVPFRPDMADSNVTDRVQPSA
ncbi:MAG: sulfotransferase domain-containing protein [Acidobacteriota bacterium]|nr:sulfotransferase domain-containing protein [Acidobacteriota bacterium]